MSSRFVPIRLNYDLLLQRGYATLTSDQADYVLTEIYETLETLVGKALMSRVSEQQVEVFEEIYESTDNTAALDWLEQNIPDYREEVQKQWLEVLKVIEKVGGLANVS